MSTCSCLLTLLLQVPAYGARPNSSFISTLDQGVVTQSGTVRVNAFLEVVGHPGVFAAGDIIDWEEQKQAVKANTHAGIVAANVLSFLEGKPLKKKYKGSPELIIIPLGKVRGLPMLVGRLGPDCCLRRPAVLGTWASCGVFWSATGLRER